MKHVPLWLLFVPQLLVVGILVYLFVRNRAMKRRQEALLEALRGKRYWRINMISPTFFQRYLRLMPFEAKGVLIDEEDSFRIQGFWLKTQAVFESRISKKDCTIEWLGNKSLRSGNIHWARLNTPKGPIQFCADTGLNAMASREALTDLFRGAFPDFPLTGAQKSDFALEKNPRSLLAVAAFLGLFLFALLDSFIFSHYELIDSQLAALASTPLLWLGAPAGQLILLVLLYQFLIRGSVPARESLVLSMFLSIAMAGAGLPALKRIDQLMADAPTQDYAYVVTSLGRLKPVDETMGLPNLKFVRANEYWRQFAEGSPYSIPLLRGPTGLWQLDHARFDPPVIAYYETHEDK